jgi:hypothetical protein
MKTLPVLFLALTALALFACSPIDTGIFDPPPSPSGSFGALASDEYQYGAVRSTSLGATLWGGSRSVMFIPRAGTGYSLCEYDPATGKTEYFCKNPLCAHNTDECAAGNALAGIEVRYGKTALLRGRVYGGGQPAQNLWISELRGGKFEFTAGPVVYYRIGPDGYYALTPDRSLVRFPFDGGAREVIIDEFRYDTMYLMNGYIYAYDSEGVCRFDIVGGGEPEYLLEDAQNSFTTDGEYLYCDSRNGGIYRVDLDGNNPETVTDMKNVYPVTMGFAGGYIYFHVMSPNENNHGDLYRVPRVLSAEPEKIGNVADFYVHSAPPCLPGKLVFMEPGNMRFFMFDTETFEASPIPLPG